MSGGTIGSFGVQNLSAAGVSLFADARSGVAQLFQDVIVVDTRTLTTSGNTPTFRRISSAVGALGLTGLEPTVTVTMVARPQPGTASMGISGQIPAVHNSGHTI